MSPFEKTAAHLLDAAFRMTALFFVNFLYKTEGQPYLLDQ